MSPFQGSLLLGHLPLKCCTGLYIVNEDTSNGGGSHWIAIHITPEVKRMFTMDENQHIVNSNFS